MSNKQKHKALRKSFNEVCLKRDKNKCVFCNITTNLDVHHITDRHEMPNGGYSLSNGITVCKDHHLDCEKFHIYEGDESMCEEKYLPNSLYKIIGSSYEKAVEDSEKL